VSVVFRPGRPEDAEAVRGFATGTFPWGDYVPAEFPRWVDRPGSLLLVGADDDVPVAVGRVVLLSPTEAWIHALRVAPERRREGIARRLLDALSSWAATEGARVVRLLVEEGNDGSHALVAAAGFAAAAPWMAASTTVGPFDAVDPRTNGGKRVPGEERLVQAPVAEAGPAWIAWSTGELARTGRQLLPFGWHLRRMTVADVEEAARRKALWQSPSGWVIADLDTDRGIVVSWMATNDLDVARLVRALLDWARMAGIERLRIHAPVVPWLVEALERTGFTISRSTVYSRPL